MARQQLARPEPAEVRSVTASPPADERMFMRRVQLAKQFPRDPAKARKELKMLAAGKTDEWGYSWPVRNKKTGKMETVEGPSIKCANAVLGVVENMDTQIEVVVTDEAWIFKVKLYDYERNVENERVFHQRRGVRIFGDPERDADVAFALGQSKAIRNAVVNYLPELVEFAWEESRKALVDTILKDPKGFKQRIYDKLKALSVPVERVVAWVGRGDKAWNAEDMARITGALTAITEGVVRADAIWPDPAQAAGPPRQAPPVRGNDEPQREEPPPAEPDKGREPGPDQGELV